MVVILPYMKEQGSGKFTIRELIDLSGMDVTTFYQTVSHDLFKSPRALTRVLRLMEVQEKLRTTTKTIEEISEDCHFVSPNCMITSFYHQFKMTPKEYRLSV